MPLFNSFQAKLNFLTFAPVVTGILSLFGSMCTILMIYRTRVCGHSLSTFHRLVLGISIPDAILSFGLSLGPLPAPPVDWLPVVGRRGTIASCTFQGFLLQFGLASFGYTNMLMIYYILVIRYGLSDEVISKKVEPILHLIPLLYHGGSSIAGLILGVFGPQTTTCFVGGHPFACEEDPSTACLRASPETLHTFGTWFTTVPVIFWTLLLILSLSVIAWTVLIKYYASRRFAPVDATGARNASTVFSKSTRLVLTQCFLYGISFINVSVWGTMPTLLQLCWDIYPDSLGKQFWLTALGLVFFPIQGLFNFLIYLRPRYLSIRDSYPDVGRWFAFKEAIWYPEAEREERNARSSYFGASARPSSKTSDSNRQANEGNNSTRGGHSHGENSSILIPSDPGSIQEQPAVESTQGSKC
jgi:hypothetical protein